MRVVDVMEKKEEETERRSNKRVRYDRPSVVR